MKNNSEFISSIYKTRKILLDILNERGYNVEDYKNFTIGEINILAINNKLDFIVFNDEGNKVYVKYVLEGSLNKSTIYSNYEELYKIEETLNNDKDELLYITLDDVNTTVIKIFNELWNNKGSFVSSMSMKRLKFNILKHKLVPKHRILNDKEKNEFKEKYNVNNELTEIPEISRYDPVAVAIGLRPGQICEITRSSKVSLDTKYYRICIL